MVARHERPTGMLHQVGNVRRAAFALVVASVCAAATFVTSATAMADTNLLANGSFANGTAGWKASNATLTIATDGNGDAAAGRVALNGTAASYQLFASPRPATTTTAGAIYTGGGLVRSDTPGKKVCLQLKVVTSGGAVVVTGSPACASASSGWTALPEATVTAQSGGDQIAYLVRRPSGATAGESFEVDDLTLAGETDTTAPTVPGGVTASPISSTRIDVSWTPSSDPDFGGVAGYHIYRDGSATALATVTGGSASSYSDTSVGPNQTHTYQVSAFDAAGNTSDRSTASAPVTTPAASPQTVGRWHLDELSGTTAMDSSGLGNNGTTNGTVSLGSPGEFGTAYSFTHGAVLIPNASSLNPGTVDITVSYWAKLTSLPTKGDYDMVVKGDFTSSGGQIKLEIQQNGQASCMFRGSLGQKQIQFGPNLADGTWHHITCKRSGSQIIETVDGSSTSFTKATGAISNTDPVRFGSHENGSDWYVGALDEVSITVG